MSRALLKFLPSFRSFPVIDIEPSTCTRESLPIKVIRWWTRTFRSELFFNRTMMERDLLLTLKEREVHGNIQCHWRNGFPFWEGREMLRWNGRGHRPIVHRRNHLHGLDGRNRLDNFRFARDLMMRFRSLTTMSVYTKMNIRNDSYYKFRLYSRRGSRGHCYLRDISGLLEWISCQLSPERKIPLFPPIMLEWSLYIHVETT